MVGLPHMLVLLPSTSSITKWRQWITPVNHCDESSDDKVAQTHQGQRLRDGGGRKVAILKHVREKDECVYDKIETS